MTDAQTPEGGALSMDEAVGLLAGAAEEPREQERSDEAAPDDDSALPEAEAAADELSGEEDGEEPELPAIPAPHSWDAEAKARFAELPRDVQDLIATRETERDRAVARAQETAASVRKQAEAELSEWSHTRAALGELIPQARETFASRWEGVDWNATLEAYGADETLRLQMQQQEEAQQLQQIEAAQQHAMAREHQRFVAEQAVELRALAPELADPRDGAARLHAIGSFLVEAGVSPDALASISAAEVSLAYDAMRWREAQKTLAKPKPAPQAARPVKPAAAVAASSPKRAADQALSRFRQTRSVDDAVAAILARQG